MSYLVFVTIKKKKKKKKKTYCKLYIYFMNENLVCLKKIKKLGPKNAKKHENGLNQDKFKSIFNM